MLDKIRCHYDVKAQIAGNVINGRPHVARNLPGSYGSCRPVNFNPVTSISGAQTVKQSTHKASEIEHPPPIGSLFTNMLDNKVPIFSFRIGRPSRRGSVVVEKVIHTSILHWMPEFETAVLAAIEFAAINRLFKFSASEP
jgi:hypothetical protein